MTERRDFGAYQLRPTVIRARTKRRALDPVSSGHLSRATRANARGLLTLARPKYLQVVIDE